MRNKNLIAMLGGGQLGLMFTEKAQMMGEEVLVLDPDKDCPAGKIADKFINAETKNMTFARFLDFKMMGINLVDSLNLFYLVFL